MVQRARAGAVGRVPTDAAGGGACDAPLSQRAGGCAPPVAAADDETDEDALLAPSQQQIIMPAVAAAGAPGAFAMSLYDAFVVDTEPWTEDELAAGAPPPPPPKPFPADDPMGQYTMLSEHLLDRMKASCVQPSGGTRAFDHQSASYP